MSTSKLFTRRLIGSNVSIDRALFPECCKITELVEEASTVDSQLRVDEERSLEMAKEAIGKLYIGSVCKDCE